MAHMPGEGCGGCEEEEPDCGGEGVHDGTQPSTIICQYRAWSAAAQHDSVVGNLGDYVGPDLIGTIRSAAHGAAEAAFLTLAVIVMVGVSSWRVSGGNHHGSQAS